MISLEFLSIETDQQRVLDKIVVELNTNHEKGKRVFVISYIPLDIDSKFLHNVIKKIMIFRQTCIDNVSVIFLLNSDPKHYEGVFSDIVGLNINLAYLKTSEEYFHSALDYGLKEYPSVKLETNEKKRVFEISGGIAGFIKPICFWIKENQKVNTINEYKELLKNDIQKFYSELPDYDLSLLQQLKKNKDISAKDMQYLSKIGAVNNEGEILSDLISSTISEYARNYELTVKNGQFFVNGNFIHNKFTPKEKEVITTLYENTYLSREDLGKILAGKMYNDYSEESIDQFFSRLRKKLKEFGVREDFIITQKRYGYKINN
jgi:hypothetical protein